MELPPELLDHLQTAQSIVALTGSGVSAESGVPTFRDAQTGLWAQYDPQQLATPEAFMRDPDLVWEWYEWRRQLVREAGPNPGHYALADLEQKAPDFTLATQNVDGLHKQAGSVNVLELHGNIRRTTCSAEHIEVDTHDAGAAGVCPGCGAPLRPDVVWFGEIMPEGLVEAASEAARACDVFLSVRTSSLVYPAASLPYQAVAAGATVIEVNPEETPLSSRADYALRGMASAVLPALSDAYGG
ncbi:NAD-dependent deacylase [soil metagenome]